MEHENAQVFNLVQAMIGLVTPNLRGASLECWEGEVRLHFLIERDNPAEREVIEDIVFEFEALQTRGLAVEVNIDDLREQSLHGDREAGYHLRQR